MVGKYVLIGVFLTALLPYSTAVTFPSGVKLNPVDEETLDAATKTLVEDPLNTGTDLFEASTPLDRDVRLSKNFKIKDFHYSGSSSDYFRADPDLIQCIQLVDDHVKNTAKLKVKIAEGYIPPTDGSTTGYQAYASTGCGASLQVNTGTTTEDDVRIISEAVLIYCPFIFSLRQRDIGVVAKSDSVYVYMAAPDVLEPKYLSDGYSAKDTQAFAQWSLDVIDSTFKPPLLPDCEHFSGLDFNQVYPQGSSLDTAVGGLDTPILRNNEDFKKLIHFSGRTAVFEDSEHTSSFCGLPDNPCVSCASQVKGQAGPNRCADRLMSSRLYNVFVTLQSLVSARLYPAKVKVLEAWDEPHSEAVSGDSPPGSVHKEGRAAVIQLDLDNTAENIKTLTQYARCAGADYVKNEGDRVTIGVKKQSGLSPYFVQFSNVGLLMVEPPSDLMSNYSLEDGADAKSYPLFDSDNQESVKLGHHITIGNVKSPSVRYFRIHPAIVRCYDALVDYEQRWDPGNNININIVLSFMTQQELEQMFDVLFDPRGLAHAHGLAMHLIYPNSLHKGKFSEAEGNKYNGYRLANAAVLNCAPIFSEAGSAMGVGLYEDGVYVDMRPVASVWADDPTMMPVGENEETMERKYRWAKDLRLFNPLEPQIACNTGTPPLPQGQLYKYKHSSNINLRRKKRAVGQDDGNDCVPKNNTEHCTVSKEHQETEIDLIWHEIKRKHLFVNEDDVRHALGGCFGACGSCVKGEYWENKMEHCNNLIHWMPFQFLNDAPDATNLYYQGNRFIKTYACHGSRQCIDKAPLYAILASSVESLFRPNRKRSVELELYDALDNPLPVFEVAYQTYGMQAKGVVTVWVKDEEEMEYLRSTLMSVMVYNQDVSKVDVYVMQGHQKSAVGNTMNNMIKDWTASVCPDVARESVAPYSIKDFPAVIEKRDLDTHKDFTEELAAKHRNFEAEWAIRTLS